MERIKDENKDKQFHKQLNEALRHLDDDLFENGKKHHHAHKKTKNHPVKAPAKNSTAHAQNVLDLESTKYSSSDPKVLE